jgi:hypothetical protein
MARLASASTATLDLLQDIHIAAATTPSTLVEHDIALGRNSICRWSRFHTSTLESFGSFEGLFAVGGDLSCLAGSLGTGCCDPAVELLVYAVAIE